MVKNKTTYEISLISPLCLLDSSDIEEQNFKFSQISSYSNCSPVTQTTVLFLIKFIQVNNMSSDIDNLYSAINEFNCLISVI